MSKKLLSNAQQRALSKLTHEFQGVGILKERVRTLELLVDKGYAESEIGLHMFHRLTWKYKLKDPQ